VPAGGRVGAVDVRFVDVRASDRYIVVVLDATGPDRYGVLSATAGALTDPHGGHVPNMPSPGDPNNPDRVELYWPRQGSGTYRLSLGSDQGPYLERDLVIR
jgi:hypothetical protein